mmetsp:Transcript_86469/g.153154  ORF Transcript_86469/g.153154 Transcript_86469/m.153154 type:complete len:396 (+) Transcript_86469:83-1270(+)
MEASFGVMSLSGFTQVALSATAVAAVLGVEVPRSLGMKDLRTRDVVVGCGRFLCNCAPEAMGLVAVILLSVALRLRGDVENFADPAAAAVWTEIKEEWPVLMGADTLLNVQAMLRLLIFFSAARRMGCGPELAGRALTAGSGSPDRAVDQLDCGDHDDTPAKDFASPLSGVAAALFLGSMLVRSRMTVQSAAYRLEGPLALGGALPGFCELAMIPALAALSARALWDSAQSAGVRVAAAAGFSVWVASRHYLNLALNPTIDSLFILAHVLEFFAALAFLGNAIWSSGQEQGNSKRGRAFLGFVNVLMAFQQGLSTYYFLTAFTPSPNTVGAGRPFCVLIMSNLLQLAAYLASAALFFGNQCCDNETEHDRTDDAVSTREPIDDASTIMQANLFQL